MSEGTVIFLRKCLYEQDLMMRGIEGRVNELKVANVQACMKIDQTNEELEKWKEESKSKEDELVELRRTVRNKEFEMEEWKKEADRKSDEMMQMIREMGREMSQLRQQLRRSEERLGVWEKWRGTN